MVLQAECRLQERIGPAFRFAASALYNRRMDEGKRPSVNWGVIGHEWAVGFLRRALLNGRNRHAYLISGSPSLGKMKLARAYTMALNCEKRNVADRPCLECRACKAVERGTDPDLLEISPVDGQPPKIDEIRQAAHTLALKPFASRYRVAIFDDFDLVAPLAQDALLKTLEEPPDYAVMILIATNAEGILPTVRSRAQLLPLRPASLELTKAALISRGCDEERADLIARLSCGRTGWALDAMADGETLAVREDLLNLLRDVLAGTRLARIKAADDLSKRVGRDKAELRQILEIWQTYWRDVALQCLDSPVKPCNGDRGAEIRALAQRIGPASALAALRATRRMLQTLDTNANMRLALDALFLDYPGLD